MGGPALDACDGGPQPLGYTKPVRNSLYQVNEPWNRFAATNQQPSNNGLNLCNYHCK